MQLVDPLLKLAILDRRQLTDHHLHGPLLPMLLADP
jgi:hypothetical protein